MGFSLLIFGASRKAASNLKQSKSALNLPPSSLPSSNQSCFRPTQSHHIRMSTGLRQNKWIDFKMLVSCKHTKNTGWMRINEILWRSAHECDTTFGFRPIWGCAEIGFLEDHLLLIGCFKELQHTAGHMVLSTLCSIISFKQHPIASESLRGDGSTKSKTLDSWYTLPDDTLLTYHILSNSRMWVLTGRLLCWYNMKKMKKGESCFIFLCRGNTSELLGHIIARWALQPTPAYPFTRNKLSNPSIAPYEMLSGWLNAREIY